MITKYNKFNESIKNLLVGPTKEEVWKSNGFDVTFDTPEEFLLYVINNMNMKEQTKDYIYWEREGKLIFEQNFENMNLYVDSKSIWLILFNIFGLNYDKIQSLIKNVVEEHLNWIGFTPLHCSDFFGTDC